MKIIGRGLTATALLTYQDQLDDVTVFASGVADSNTTDVAEFEREYVLLYETLESSLKHNQRIVYFSSGGAIYGARDDVRSERTPLFPTTPYGRHKLLCEALIRQSTLPYLIVRLPNLIGGQQNKTQLIPALIHQALQGKVTLFEHATRDLLDVDDMAMVLVKLLHKTPESHTVVLASGYSIPVTHMFDEIQQILATNAQITYLAKGDRQVFDTAHLHDLLDSDLSFTPDYFKQVLAKYVQTLAKHLP